MRYLTLGEVVELHRRLLQVTGGAPGIRDFGALESAIAQPKATFGDVDLYPTLPEKAAALGFSLVQSHPFVGGNKRVAHAAMETFRKGALPPSEPPPPRLRGPSPRSERTIHT